MIYSQQSVHSTNFSSDLKQSQENIVYNWSGLNEIARETQLVRPTNVEQLVRLVRTARSKVNTSLRKKENVRFVYDLVFSRYPSLGVVLRLKN